MSTYTTTIRMDQELADRLDVLSSVIGESKNTVLTSALRMFLSDYENDPDFQSRRTAWVQQAMEVE